MKSPTEIEIIKAYSSGNKNSFSHAKVLLAEDSIVKQKIATKYLESFGCHVTWANDGHEALDSLKYNDFDLIFMECEMPHLDEFLEKMQNRIKNKKKEGKPIPIVALISKIELASEERFLDLDIKVFMGNPVNRKKFFAALMTYLSPQT